MDRFCCMRFSSIDRVNGRKCPIQTFKLLKLNRTPSRGLANVYPSYAFRLALRLRNPRASVDLQACSLQIKDTLLHRCAYNDRSGQLDHVGTPNHLVVLGFHACVDAVVLP